jgi:hypothetical protein
LCRIAQRLLSCLSDRTERARSGEFENASGAAAAVPGGDGRASPGDIAWPVRSVFARPRNVRIMMMDIHAVDTAARTVSDSVATPAYDHRRRDWRRNGGHCRRAIAAACKCQSRHLWKQLLFELPTGMVSRQAVSTRRRFSSRLLLTRMGRSWSFGPGAHYRTAK